MVFVDQDVNNEDPYGDGDQSYVKADDSTDPGSRLQDFLSAGPGNTIMTACREDGSKFMLLCLFGNADLVKQSIACTAPGSIERMQLLELRVSSMRYSALMTCIFGSKDMRNFGYTDGNHFATADILCSAGANVNAKDLGGYKPSHHATTPDTATAESLAIFRLITNKYDANPDLAHRFGNTSLIAAIIGGNEVSLDTLLSNGAKVGHIIK
jgi:hypothetical protein